MKKSFIAGFIVVTCAIACVLIKIDLNASACFNNVDITPAVDDYNFGSVAVGGSKSLSLTLVNNGDCNISNFALSLSGDDSDQYSIINNTCPATFNVDTTCTATLVFTPTAPEYFDKAQVTAKDTVTPVNYDTINLFGTGITAEEAALRTAASLILGQSDSGSDGCNATASTGIAGKNSSTASALGLAALLGMVMGTVALRRRRRKK